MEHLLNPLGTQSDPPIAWLFQSGSGSHCTGWLVAGVAVLVGWCFNLPDPRCFLPGRAATNLLTALIVYSVGCLAFLAVWPVFALAHGVGHVNGRQRSHPKFFRNTFKTPAVNRPESGFVCLAVGNNGLGIAVDQLPNLFLVVNVFIPTWEILVPDSAWRSGL